MMFRPLFNRTQKEEKLVLAAATLPCQLPSPLLPSEMRAINTLSRFKESPLVCLSIDKIATDPSHFPQSLSSLTQATLLCKDLNLHGCSND